MKLRLLLTTFCLLGIGIFSHAQDKKKATKPTVEDGVDPMPITVTSTKKSQKKPPPPPKVETVKFAPPKIVKDGKSQPKVVDEKIVVPAKPAKNGDKSMPPPPPPPKIVDDKKVVPAKPAKDGDKQIPPPPPPPKPAKEKSEKPVAPDAPPVPDERAYPPTP